LQNINTAMKVYLMNSAMMPAEGIYTLKRITIGDFEYLLIRAYMSGQLENHIGYEQNLKLIADWCDIRLSPDRTEVHGLQDGDRLLIMKLKYRVSDTALKTDKKFQNSVSADDFDFFLSEYKGS